MQWECTSCGPAIWRARSDYGHGGRELEPSLTPLPNIAQFRNLPKGIPSLFLEKNKKSPIIMLWDTTSRSLCV